MCDLSGDLVTLRINLNEQIQNMGSLNDHLIALFAMQAVFGITSFVFCM